MPITCCDATREVTNRFWIEQIIKCYGEGCRDHVEADPLMALFGLCDAPFKQQLQAELNQLRKHPNAVMPFQENADVL